MKLNRLYRRILGEEGERQIARNGDVINAPVKLSVRAREIRKIRKRINQYDKISADDGEENQN